MEESFPYLREKFEALDDSDKLDFLYETDWRLTISSCPNHVVWYIDAIKGLDIRDNKTASLKLSLLTTYRLGVMWEDFETLESKLIDYFEHHESDMGGRLFYERCQYYLQKLDFAKVRAIVADWYVSDVDYQSLFWKANVLNSLGDVEKSAVLLEIIRKRGNKNG